MDLTKLLQKDYCLSFHRGDPVIAPARSELFSLQELFLYRQTSFEEISRWLPRILLLLDWSRDIGLLHRCLTPEAILVDDRDVALGGWEYCAPLSPKAPPLNGYCAPEVLRKSEVDHRSDLFSLGAILYQWLTRRAPFSGESSVTLLKSILDKRPTPKEIEPDCPLRLSSLCVRLLQVEKEARPHSARAVLLLL